MWKYILSKVEDWSLFPSCLVTLLSLLWCLFVFLASVCVLRWYPFYAIAYLRYMRSNANLKSLKMLKRKKWAIKNVFMYVLFAFVYVGVFAFDFVHLIMVFILISYAPSAKSLCTARYLYWPFILILENRASSTNISLRASNIHKIGDGLGFQISSVCECRGLLPLSIFRAELFRTTLAYSNLIENS